MSVIPTSIQNLISDFQKLPSVGPKSASRMVFSLLQKSDSDINRFGEHLLDLKKKLTTCKYCHNYTEKEVCKICNDNSRSDNIICVVEDFLDVFAFEKYKVFDGVYHVLGGVISPINDVYPDDLNIKDLISRITELDYKKVEVIIATNLTMEGEATGMYIQKTIGEDKVSKNKEIIVTRIAKGMPNGADLKYTDNVTLKRALENRVEL